VTTKRFFCTICNEDVEHEAPNDDVYEGIAASTEHFRVFHPEVFATIQTWPDGEVVVVDDTLTPVDFNKPAGHQEPGEEG